MNFIIRYLLKIEKAGKPAWALLGLCLLLAVTVTDYMTGSDLSLSLFYLIPIAFFSWVFSAGIGVGVAFISAAIWLFVELITTSSHESFAYLWNTIIRLGFFLLPATMLKSIEQERLHARTDYLTNAFNNRYFNELLEREIERSIRYEHPFTLVFIDLDNFKTMNDTFGHMFGDKVLSTIATNMKKHLRKTDIIARVGGDEFSLLLPETNLEEAKIALTNLFAKIELEMQEEKWPVTFSVGSLTLTAPSITVDQMLTLVDKLMYIVKNNGKNNIKFAIYTNEEKISHLQS
jgi:diguanylate cyclase (GGDEF)-like protein